MAADAGGTLGAASVTRPITWITRTLPGAHLTAARVDRLGWSTLLRPLLEVRPLLPTLTLEGVGALAFTSPNGVAAFACPDAKRGLPVFAVGDGTARVARGAGFGDVMSADGDVHDLVALILHRRDRFTGRLLRPGARHPAGDFDATLLANGVQAESCAVYETTPTAIGRDSPEIARLASGEIAAVLIHSPRAGRRLAMIAPPSPSCRVICISAAAASPLASAGWPRIEIADHPSERGLLNALAPGSADTAFLDHGET